MQFCLLYKYHDLSFFETWNVLRSLVRACLLSTSVFQIFQQKKEHAQMVYLVSVDQQKAEERGINTAPNKRTRTSMVDVRPNTAARSSVSVEKDREALRGPTSNGVQGEDRASPIVADGWEKVKMKKKRSVIKADAASSLSSVSSKSNDGYREPKQGIYPRNLPDSRSTPTDTFGSRPGSASKLEQESKNIRAVNKIGV